MKTFNKTFKLNMLAMALATAGVSTSVLADQYHYKDQLIGDRAAGLGGAYTAIADDASGLYYNPAGVVYTSETKVSGSVNAYNLKTTEYSNISKANPSQKWTRTSSGMVANYFGVIQPYGDATIGFSIAIPNYELEDQSDEFTNTNGSTRLSGVLNGTGVSDTSAATATISNNNIDFNNEDNTTLVGVSYAKPLSTDLSIGMTLYGYMRKRETTNWQFVQAKSDDGNKTLDGTYYQKLQTNEIGVQPRFGLMWSPADKLSVGVMVQKTLILSQTPESRVYEKYTVSDNQGTAATADDTLVALNSTLTGYDFATIPNLSATTDNDLPFETNIGVAYFATDALLYSADFSYATETNVYQATWNASAGAEYYLDGTWAVRGGVYTNNANTDSNVAVNLNDHINLTGLSFSVSRYTKGSNITAGMSLSNGSGKANLFNSSTNTQNIDTTALAFFISTSAAF